VHRDRQPEGRSVAMAALCNGTAAHGEDFDDTTKAARSMPAPSSFRRFFATAEAHGLTGDDAVSASPRDAKSCAACAPSRRSACIRRDSIRPRCSARSVPPPVVGAALELDAKQLVDAMGIAASMASGIIEYLAEGAWTKRMHPGWAAQSGYRAARMAQAGFVGPRTVFEGEHGLFHGFAHTRDGNLSRDAEGFGVDWLAAGIAFKPYACGTMAHPYIDCARRLVAAGLDPAMCRRSNARPPKASSIGCGSRSPTSSGRRTATRQSSAFPTRSPWRCCNDAGLPNTTKPSCEDPKVRALAAKVRYRIDPGNPIPASSPATVRVTLAKRRGARGAAGPPSRRRRRAVAVRRHPQKVSRQCIAWKSRSVAS
jgi:2-methylcitrate dehydratase PrpD